MPQSWPRRQPSKNTWRAPTFAPLPTLAPEEIPDQLKLLGANTLADMLERAELTDALKARGPFTIFAPTDEAFEKLIGKKIRILILVIIKSFLCLKGQRGDEYKNELLSDRLLLQNILLQHVAPEQLKSNDLRDGLRIKTLADNTITVLNTRDGKTIAGSLFTRGGMNNIAENGVIHFIDSVIYPYVSDEEATTPRPKTVRLFGSRDDPDLLVRVNSGRLRGVNMNRDVRAWLGVPYAEPPTGRFRFSRPRAIRAWDSTEIRDATRQPNACPQTPDEFFGNFSGSQQWNPNTRISEDCLYLNVYAPRNLTDLEDVS